MVIDIYLSQYKYFFKLNDFLKCCRAASVLIYKQGMILLLFSIMHLSFVMNILNADNKYLYDKIRR